MDKSFPTESQVSLMSSVDLAKSEQATPPALTGPATCRLEANIIGPLRIRRGETVLGYGELGGPKPRQILELLLLNLGAPVSKDRLIDILWAGQAPPEALPTLESYVSVLRRHLQPGMGKDGPLRTVTGGYMLDRALVDLDLDRFESLVHGAESATPQRAIVLLQEALGLASAPLMGDELVPSWAEAGRTAMRHALSMRGFWRRRPSTDDDGVAAASRVLAAAAPATRAGPSGQGHIRCRARRPLPLPLT